MTKTTKPANVPAERGDLIRITKGTWRGMLATVVGFEAWMHPIEGTLQDRMMVVIVHEDQPLLSVQAFNHPRFAKAEDADATVRTVEALYRAHLSQYPRQREYLDAMPDLFAAYRHTR